MKRNYVGTVLFLAFCLIMPKVIFGIGINYEITSSEDFSHGISNGINCTETIDQLQLNKKAQVYPYIWIANSADGTLSKLDTATGKEVARYRTGVNSLTNPSRTAVDNEGNCWVANRGGGRIVKIAMNGGIDKNGNGIIDTSHDKNNNGAIEPSEMLAWGEDEAVLVDVLPGHSNSGPRAVAIDLKGRIWIGLYSDSKFAVLNPEDGSTIKIINVTTGPYGAVIDNKGILWSSGRPGNRIEKIDTNTDQFIKYYNLGTDTYGIAVDKEGIVWVAGYSRSSLMRFDPKTESFTSHYSSGTNARGVTVDNDGNVWVAFSGNSRIVKFDNNGNQVMDVALSPEGNHPIGVALDHEGYIWAVNRYSNNTIKISPNGEKVGVYAVGREPYTYSDMTGFIYKNFTNHEGTWIVKKNSDIQNCNWANISWEEEKPTGTEIKVFARASDVYENLILNNFQEIKNSIKISGLEGRYLEVKVMLSTTNNNSPILKSLNIISGNTPPDFDKLGRKATYEMMNLEFDILASDYDNDNLSYVATDIPAGAVYNDANSRLIWTPDYNQAGEYIDIQVAATDGPNTSNKEVNIAVFNKNRRPDIEVMQNNEVVETEVIEIPINVSDPDGDNVEVSISNLPKGSLYQEDTKKIVWTPDYDQAGNYENIKIYAADNNLATKETINIIVVNKNRAPKFEDISKVEVKEMEEIKFTVNALDPDNDDLIYSIENLPQGATFDTLSKEFFWTPTYDQAGVYTVTFIVNDGELEDKKNVVLNILEADITPPESTVSLSGTKWSDDNWFKSNVDVEITAEDDPEGTGVAAIYYKIGEDGIYKKYTGSFTLEENKIYELHVYAVDNNGNEETPHMTEIKISKPWVQAPYTVLVEQLRSNGKIELDSIFVNGRIEINGRCDYGYIGTHSDRILKNGNGNITKLELSQPYMNYPVPDWKALESITEVRPEQQLKKKDTASNAWFKRNLVIESNKNLSGILVVEGDLMIHGNSVLNNVAIFCKGRVVISGNIEMSGLIYSENGLIINSQPEINGAIITKGEAILSGEINKNQNMSIENYLQWLKVD